MFRRISVVVLLVVLLLIASACTNKKVSNPLADVGSKQPDKVLFDRSVDAMAHRKYDVARLSLQTLINTYPDSEYVARAKLGIADAWYAEGGTAALAQAESEYKDFITFFPNMPEAAEAQLKVAGIHYRQMEKADRDYTHAKRAEDEYRQVLLQFPDSKLAEEAKKKLLEVQEVLADREFRIGRFYYMKESWTASIARLKSLTDSYPLYSQADDALFMLGDANEKEIELLRAWKEPNTKAAASAKALLIRNYTDAAAEAYSKIITRYPVMGRADDAKKRLEALDRPIPKPTDDAIAQNKKEQEGREEAGRIGKLMDNIHKRPDVKMAAKNGEPTLVDPKQTDAPAMIKAVNDVVRNASEPAGGGGHNVSVETVKDGKVPESQATPRSDSGSDENAPAQAPAQVNEVNQQDKSSDASAAPATTGTPDQKSDNESSSKSKKKKGLRKIIPF